MSVYFGSIQCHVYFHQRTTDALNREMMILQQSRVELEKHIEKLVKEREELNKKIEESKTLKSEEARVSLNFYEFLPFNVLFMGLNIFHNFLLFLTRRQLL